MLRAKYTQLEGTIALAKARIMDVMDARRIGPASGWLEILPVGSSVRITLVIRIFADLYRHDGMNLPKREAFRLPG